MSHLAACDWRVQVLDCDGAEFFSTLWLVDGVLAACDLLLCVGLLVYRFGVQRMSLFYEGEIRGHESMIIVGVCYSSVEVAYAFTIDKDWKAGDGARDVVFALRFVFSFAALLVFLLTLFRAIPAAYIDSSRNVHKSLVPSRMRQYYFSALLWAEVAIGVIVLHSIVGVLRVRGDPAFADVYKAAFGFVAANAIFTSMALALGGYNFHSIMKVNLAEVDRNDPQNQLIALHSRKIEQQLAMFLSGAVIISTLTTIMATFEPFHNVDLSKALAVMLVSGTTGVAVVILLLTILIDYFKARIAAKSAAAPHRGSNSSPPFSTHLPLSSVQKSNNAQLAVKSQLGGEGETMFTPRSSEDRRRSPEDLESARVSPTVADSRLAPPGSPVVPTVAHLRAARSANDLPKMLQDATLQDQGRVHSHEIVRTTSPQPAQDAVP